MPPTLLAKAREKGIEESLQLGRDAVHATIRRFSRDGDDVSIFLSPPMNNSGAPHVLMDVVEEFAGRPGTVRLLSAVIPPELRERAHACGVRVERAAAVMGPTLVGLQLALRKDDFVLMNTVAISRSYLDFALDSLERGKLAHAYWYIHEDVHQLPVRRRFYSARDPIRVRRLMPQRRLTILVPSHNVKAQYDALFNADTTRLLPHRMSIGAS